MRIDQPADGSTIAELVQRVVEYQKATEAGDRPRAAGAAWQIEAIARKLCDQEIVTAAAATSLRKLADAMGLDGPGVQNTLRYRIQRANKAEAGARLGGTGTWSAGRPAEREPEPESYLASREQVAQWRAETLDRLAAHPEIVATPEPDVPGYWVLRTPQGEELGAEITRTITDLRDRGIRVQRPDGSELRGDLKDWSHESARARQWEKEQG